MPNWVALKHSHSLDACRRILCSHDATGSSTQECGRDADKDRDAPTTCSKGIRHGFACRSDPVPVAFDGRNSFAQTGFPGPATNSAPKNRQNVDDSGVQF